MKQFIKRLIEKWIQSILDFISETIMMKVRDRPFLIMNFTLII